MMPNSFHPFVLSPIDHLHTKGYPGFMLSFKPKDPQSCVLILKSAATALLEKFPFMAGEIVTLPELNGIKNVDKVVPPLKQITVDQIFQVKSFNSSLSSFTTLASGATRSGKDTLDFINQLSAHPMLLPPADRQPTMGIQVNVFSDGIILAVDVCHHVFDGPGEGHIIETLAYYCQHPPSDYPPTPPVCQYEKQKAVFDEFRTIATDPISHMDDVSRMQGEQDVPPERLPEIIAQLAASLSTIRFSFPDSQARALADQCNELLAAAAHRQGDPGTPPPKVSRNDVLTALLSVCIKRARIATQHTGAADPNAIELLTGVNMRERLNLPASKDYIGNMALTRIASMQLDENAKAQLTGNGSNGSKNLLPIIAELAAIIRNKLRTMDAQHFQDVVSYVQQTDEWSKPYFRFAGDVNFGTARYFDAYNLQFGAALGPVKTFDFPLGITDGICFFVPPSIGRKGEDKPWEVDVTVDAKSLELLRRDDLICWILGEDDVDTIEAYRRPIKARV